MPQQVVIGILNRASDADRRECIRNTWGQWATDNNIPYVFLCGYGDVVSQPCLVEDVLMLPCPDDYGSLPQKTRLFCHWAVTHTKCRHIFKCDDDTFVHIPRLKQFDPQGKDYVGVSCRGNIASGGGGYLLSRKAATIVGNNKKDNTGAEDVITSSILKRHKIMLTKVDVFDHALRGKRPPTKINRMITTHYVSPPEMTHLYETLS